MTVQERRTAIVTLLVGAMRTGAWIAEQVGASDRTVYRDIAALKREGQPILGERGVGYMLRPRRQQFQDWQRGI